MHYLASNMRLVIYANETIEMMTGLILKSLKVKEMVKVERENDFYKFHYFRQDQNHLAKCIYIVPISKEHRLVLSFPIRSWMWDYKKTNPTGFISNLIGHEGPGSLLSLLREKNLATRLMAGEDMQAPGISMYQITIVLSENGLDQTDEIIGLVFQYIYLIRVQLLAHGLRLFEEITQILHTDFQQQERGDAVEFVTKTSSLLQSFEIEDVLINYNLHNEYRLELIVGLLDVLIPERLRYSIISQKVAGKAVLTERFYGFKYGIYTIPSQVILNWKLKMLTISADLHLPEPNPYICTKFELKPIEEQQKRPLICSQETHWRNWFQPRAECFLSARALYAFFLRSPIFEDIYNKTCLRAFIWHLREKLNEKLYSASLAGLSFDLQVYQSGFIFVVSGYDEKLPMLLVAFEDELNSINADGFQLAKEHYMLTLKEFSQQELRDQAFVFLNELTLNRYMSIGEELEEAPKVTFEEAHRVFQSGLNKSFIEGFVNGNVKKEDVQQLIKLEYNLTSKATACPSSDELQRQQTVVIPKGKLFLHQRQMPDHDNNAILNCFQFGESDIFNQTITRLLGQLLGDRFFNDLRTNQSLGYIVSMSVHTYGSSDTIVFYIQSEKSPDELDIAIDQFLSKSSEYLKNLPEEEFNRQKESLLVQLLEKPKSLLAEADELWSQIYRGTYMFDARIQYQRQLAGIDKQLLMMVYEDRMISNPSKLSIQLYGNKIQTLPACVRISVTNFFDTKNGASFQNNNLLFFSPQKEQYVKVKSGVDLKKDALFYPSVELKVNAHLSSSPVPA